MVKRALYLIASYFTNRDRRRLYRNGSLWQSRATHLEGSDIDNLDTQTLQRVNVIQKVGFVHHRIYLKILWY